MKTHLNSDVFERQCKTSSIYSTENNWQKTSVRDNIGNIDQVVPKLVTCLAKQQTILIPHNFSFRKLSSVSLNYLQTSLFLRGEKMKIFHEICVVNPNVIDTYYTDDEGINRLVECANQHPKKEVHRY